MSVIQIDNDPAFLGALGIFEAIHDLELKCPADHDQNMSTSSSLPHVYFIFITIKIANIAISNITC